MNYSKNLIIPYEEQEQIAVVDWLEAHQYQFTAIPNSTYTKSWKQKQKNTRMGLRAGLPDLLIILPESKGLLFIEMKRREGGKVKEHQKEWIDALNKIEGVEAVVAEGYDQAIAKIEDLIKS